MMTTGVGAKVGIVENGRFVARLGRRWVCVLVSSLPHAHLVIRHCHHLNSPTPQRKPQFLSIRCSSLPGHCISRPSLP